MGALSRQPKFNVWGMCQNRVVAFSPPLISGEGQGWGPCLANQCLMFGGCAKTGWTPSPSPDFGGGAWVGALSRQPIFNVWGVCQNRMDAFPPPLISGEGQGWGLCLVVRNLVGRTPSTPTGIKPADNTRCGIWRRCRSKNRSAGNTHRRRR